MPHLAGDRRHPAVPVPYLPSVSKRPDQLEPWSIWLRDALAARGRPARLAYDDKVGGDVLLLSIDSGERDRLVELTITRRARGRAHLTVLATSPAGAAAARDALGRMHDEVSRLANAKRKFVHRIERMLERLVATWDERAAQPAPERDAALERLRGALPEAWPMIGLGFHTDVAGVDDHHTRDVYPSVFGAAVGLDGRWRGLAWEPERRRWLIRNGTLTALRRARPGVDLDAGGITLLEALGVGAAAVVATAAVAAAADIDTDVEGAGRQNARSCADSMDPCDVLDCSLGLADLGSCVPDCDVLDCGALDCSL